jgi:hypothetical protein
MALRECLACPPAQLAKRVVFHCFKEARTRTTVIGHPLREARVRCSARRGFGQFGGYSNPGTGKYLRHLAWEFLRLPVLASRHQRCLTDSVLSFIRKFWKSSKLFCKLFRH